MTQTALESELLDDMYFFVRDMGHTQKDTLANWRGSLLSRYRKIRNIGEEKERLPA